MKNFYIDFDNVLNSNSLYKDDNNLCKPEDNICKFIQDLSENYNINVITTRNVEKVKKWLKDYGFDSYIYKVLNKNNQCLQKVKIDNFWLEK